MTDETDNKPLAELADAERKINPPTVGKEPLPFDEIKPGMAPARTYSEPMPAAARLRAFEDEHFGEDAVRIDGKIERGSGSPFSEMSDEDRRKYEAIERLIAAEQKLADAHTALIQADADYDAAEAALDAAPRE